MFNAKCSAPPDVCQPGGREERWRCQPIIGPGGTRAREYSAVWRAAFQRWLGRCKNQVHYDYGPSGSCRLWNVRNIGTFSGPAKPNPTKEAPSDPEVGTQVRRWENWWVHKRGAKCRGRVMRVWHTLPCRTSLVTQMTRAQQGIEMGRRQGRRAVHRVLCCRRALCAAVDWGEGPQILPVSSTFSPSLSFF